MRSVLLTLQRSHARHVNSSENRTDTENQPGNDISFKFKKTSIIAIALAIFRIIIGLIMPLSYGFIARDSYLDDYLMLEYSNLSSHFHPSTPWDILRSLIKPMSYSYFLAGIRAVEIPYLLAFALLWVVAASVAITGLRNLYYAVIRETSTGWVSQVSWLLAYTFLLFSPTGFDAATGQRIYRESILAPITLLLAGIMFHYIVSFIRKETMTRQVSKQFAIGIALGIIWIFFWFIKESSIWLAPLLVMTLLVCCALQVAQIIHVWKSAGTKAVKSFTTLLLACSLIAPLAVIGIGSWTYGAINNHYYGVPYASVRTEGEIAGFFERLYQIEDPNRTDLTWVPWSTMQQAIDASPTLRNNKELIAALTSPKGAFASPKGWKETPTPSDMGVWSMLFALQKAGLYNNQTDAQKFFKQVNTELDAAHLPQSKGFTPIKLLPKKTWQDIPALINSLKLTMEPALLWNHFTLLNENDIICDDVNTADEVNNAAECRLVETDLNVVVPKRTDAPSRVRNYQYTLYQTFAQNWFAVCAVIAIPLLISVILTTLMAIETLVSRLWRKRIVQIQNTWLSLTYLAITCACATAVFAILLAVAWQYPVTDQVDWYQLKYYTIASIPLVQIIEICSIIGIFRFCRSKVAKFVH